MCGIVYLHDGTKIEIDCEILAWPWRPPIDFAQIIAKHKDPVTDPDGPPVWKEKLNYLGAVLAGSSVLQDSEMSAALGGLAAELGSRIAADANLNIKFDYNAHGAEHAIG